jgi:phenylalanyl-tRNA synthetase beta chain
MQFPESWLRTFCDPALSTQQLADALTMAGLEVEALQPVAPPFSGVVVGEIKAVAQHPNADRLRVCQVDIGAAALLHIVCGAPNARVGIRVPCATVGAELPPGADGKPFLIKLGQLRGVESQGMLCSASELRVSEASDGLLELASDAPIGQNIRAHMQLDDTLFTLKLTPNLAHCLSVLGVAREVSALTGAPLKVPAITPMPVGLSDVLPVHIAATDLCGRFSGRIVRNVNPQAKTPAWMVDRLARCGQRSVSALVDISNYVMFELGRPTHIFDLEKIHGGLQVRWAHPGEQLKLLNGNTVELDAQVGVIADDQQVESLAGIMGGDATAVGDTTRHIYVEAAFWWPTAVAGRSRRFNFSTDAGHRFERGVDPALTVAHIERISQLIAAICGTPETTFGPIDDQQPAMPQARPVQLRVARAVKVIGMPLTAAQCLQALARLGLEPQEQAGVITVQPPSYRFDLQIEEDLIEEVARVIGFDHIPHTPPQAPVTARLRPEGQRSAFALRRALAGLGYQETINFSFVDARWEHELAGNPNPIKLLNPIASQMGVMRSSLLGSLIQVAQFNQARKVPRVRVFELGRVFLRDASVVDSDTTVAQFDQPMRAAGLALGSADTLQWGRSDAAVDFFDAKGDVEALFAPQRLEFVPASASAHHPALHPGRSASVILNGVHIGVVGELHPQWRQSYGLSAAPIVFELDLAALLRRPVPAFEPIAKFPAVQRDIALLLPETCSHAALIAAIQQAPHGGLLQDAQLFDVYRPKTPQADDKARSLAVRLTLASAIATLTEAEIDAAMQAIWAHLAQTLGARPRT